MPGGTALLDSISRLSQSAQGWNNAKGILSLRIGSTSADEEQTLRGMFAYAPPQRFRLSGYTTALGQVVADIMLNEQELRCVLPQEIPLTQGTIDLLAEVLPDFAGALWLREPWVGLIQGESNMRNIRVTQKNDTGWGVVIPRGRSRYLAEFSSDGQLRNVIRQQRIFPHFLPIYRSMYTLSYDALGEKDGIVFPQKVTARIAQLILTIEIMEQNIQFNTELKQELFAENKD